MLKKCKVVMLPTSQKAGFNYGQLCIDTEGFYKNKLVTIHKPNLKRVKPQHLYILSDDEIEKNDWFVKMKSFNGKPSLYQEKKKPFINSEWLNGPEVNDCFKVIACTDQSLDLPELSQAFIYKYVDLHNKGQQIEEVNVEYEKNWKPKISSDNTITIRKIKDSYTRDEVVELFDKLNQDLQTEYNVDCPYSVIEDWLKENL